MDKQYISVFALNKYIQAKMDQDISLQRVFIKGEISNYRPHPSGHLYFTLKDKNSCVSAVMFASAARKLDFTIENGMQVLLQARVSVYEVTGQYQLYVKSMQQDGIGNLYLQFVALKKKLEDEGLFDSRQKKNIPVYPKSIAVLSAKNGDAVQDVVRTIHLRFPFVKVIVFPIPVQGKNAYVQIINVLKQVDQLGFSTIILARGGGSIENLWNFNEEALVRAIYDCQTPVITGIGHETDFTICDFVSDYRAVTPTAAAIKATPDQNEMRKHNDELYHQLIYKMKHRVDISKQRFDRLKNSYYLSNPEHLYSNQILRVTQLQDQLTYQFKVFDMKVFQTLATYQSRLKQNIDYQLQNRNYQLQKIMTSLDALSPLKVMQRGYTIVKKDDVLLKSAKDVQSGDFVDIQFYDGIKKAQVK